MSQLDFLEETGPTRQSRRKDGSELVETAILRLVIFFAGLFANLASNWITYMVTRMAVQSEMERIQKTMEKELRR